MKKAIKTSLAFQLKQKAIQERENATLKSIRCIVDEAIDSATAAAQDGKFNPDFTYNLVAATDLGIFEREVVKELTAKGFEIQLNVRACKLWIGWNKATDVE